METLNQILLLKSGKSCILRNGNAQAVIGRKEKFWYLNAYKSLEPVFLNDLDVRSWAKLASGDQIRLGDKLYLVPNLKETDSTTVLALENGTITVQDGGRERNILNHVSVSFRKGEFIGIVGGSGSGKSTLMKSLAGINKLTEGSVILHESLIPQDKLMSDSRIAYLPQDVVIHETLTPLRALTYIVKLKNAAETEEECRNLIEEVLSKTGMLGHIQTPINRLSGGERKRVALAAELIGDPEIILLDEATSGLDPATDEEMMYLFRQLADSGKTVICITHAPENLKLCDRVLYVMRGNVIFSGPLPDCLRFFGAGSIKEMYEKQNSRKQEEWQNKFISLYGSPAPIRSGLSYQPPTPKNRAFASLSQLSILTARYTRLQICDKINCLLLFLQIPLIAAMICAFRRISPEDSLADQAGTIKGVIFAMMLSMLWCAGTSSVREIVKETSILTHEVRFGVRTGLYLFSKLIFLFVIVLIQALLMLIIVRTGTGLPGCPGHQFLLLVGTGLSGITLGLLVSAFSKNIERAMTLLPIILIAQAIFAGVLFNLEGITKFIARMAVPAYWSLQGLTGTFSQEIREAGLKAENLILGYGVSFGTSFILLLLMTLIPLLFTKEKLTSKFDGHGLFASNRFSISTVFRITLAGVCFAAIGAMGSAIPENTAPVVKEFDFTDYQYEEIDLPIGDLLKRIHSNTIKLNTFYEIYYKGDQKSLFEAVNHLDNLRIRDNEVYRSEERAFLLIREKIETAEECAFRNIEICPKTENLKARLKINTEALNRFYDNFKENNPKGLNEGYNYLKNIELKDISVFNYEDPSNTAFQEIRAKIEKTKEQIDEAYKKIRDEIHLFDTVEENRKYLDRAKDILEELTEMFPSLKSSMTVENLSRQIESRSNDIAAVIAADEVEKELDDSRKENFADLDIPKDEESEELESAPEINMKGKAPEQIKNEKERIKENKRNEAKEQFSKELAELQDRLERGYTDIDAEIKKQLRKLDIQIDQFPVLKNNDTIKDLRKEIEFESKRLRFTLTISVYEKSNSPFILDKARERFQETEVPELSHRPEQQSLLQDQYDRMKTDLENAEITETVRSSAFKSAYQIIETKQNAAESVSDSELIALRNQIKTVGELDDFFDLLYRNSETSEIQKLPGPGTVAGEETVITIRNVEFPFVWCPAGTFTMGSPVGEIGRNEDETEHKVTLTNGYWILKTEVTQEMYAVVTESTPPCYQILTNDKYIKELYITLVKNGVSQNKAEECVKNLDTKKFPVESVTWNQAAEFCEKLNKFFSDGNETNTGFYLPTEAQWEYACRAGKTEIFSADPYKIINADRKVMTPVAKEIRVKEYGAIPVDEIKVQNDWGIKGMHGNLCEWCRDAYKDYPTGPVTDPAPEGKGDRVIRGGSWKVKMDSCRSAGRRHASPSTREQTIGFRIVLSRN